MNHSMIRILIRKDMRLLAVPVLCYLAAGLVSVGLMGVEQHAFFYGGSVLLITATIALGFHPPMATVVGERKEQTLAFVMSMPITPTDYTWSKLLANLLLFFVPWAVLLAATVGLILLRPSLPDGLIPYSVILLGAIAGSAVLILCIGIVSESMHWTIATQIVCNLVFQAVMYGASNAPAIKATMQGEVVDWNPAALTFLGIELAVAVIALPVTLWLQSRKTDFL
jgi:ABC-2 type transport system permease protein